MDTGIIASSLGNINRHTSESGAPTDLARFLGALFDPSDVIGIRPIETWIDPITKQARRRILYDAIEYAPAGVLVANGRYWAELLAFAEAEKANLFFTVCPRFGPRNQYERDGARLRWDRAWQIRVVRALWADLDHCAVDEALTRCDNAGVQSPSVLVRSGYGCQLQWLLDTPYAIDDAGDPPGIGTEFVDQGPGKKRLPRKYALTATGRVYLFERDPMTGGDSHRRNPDFRPTLTAKAQYIQNLLAGIAAAINGDHTNDLSRLLRLPGTLNRKDERNGKSPVPCVLIECDPEKRYPLEAFARFLPSSPSTTSQQEQVAPVQLLRFEQLTQLTHRDRDRLAHLIHKCRTAQDRSKADWALVCWCLRRGIDKELLWEQVHDVGKFAERGRDYFELTWSNAEERIRQRIHACSGAQPNGEASRNGTCLASPSEQGGNGPNGPDDPQGEGHAAGDSGPPLPESDTDPHRLAREWLAREAQHERPGDCAAYYRQTFLRWGGSHWTAIPDHEMRAIINRFIRELLVEQTRLRLMERGIGGQDQKPCRVPIVSKKLVADVIAALEGLVLVPQTIQQPSWRGPGHPGPPNWIALRNGILDVDAYLTGAEQVLRPHTPLWFSTTSLPYDFDPAADCPRWRAFLARNLGDDPDKQRLLQQWTGYLLLHDTSLQRFLVMVGEGANGKSVVCVVIIALLGEDNVSTEPLELLGDKFRLVGTLGKLANITAEVGELDKVAEGILKAFVSGDPMSFEPKFKAAFTSRPTARMMLATNNVPYFSDKSDGLWRRMLLLPFAVQIPEEERTPGLTKREFWLASGELPGILNWALAGLADLRQQGRFVVPASCQEVVDRVRIECNPARRFLLDGYGEREGTVTKAELYRAYRQWCEQHGHHAMSDIGFGKEVKRTFPRAKDGKLPGPCPGQRENAWVGILPRTAIS